jgi:hypothetical protein
MDPEFARGRDGVIRAAFPEARFRASLQELGRRLAAEPGIAGISYADRLPRTHHPARRVEVSLDGVRAAGDGPRRAGPVAVALDFFDVLGAPIQSGRAFHSGDLGPDPRTVIVNASFGRRVLDGRNPIGLWMRELPDGPAPVPGPWLEIVGVAPDLGVMAGDPSETAGYYRPASPGAVLPANLIVHVRGDVAPAVARLHTLAAGVDPGLRLHDVARMSDGDPTMWLEFAFLFKLLTVVSGIALLLSLAGIYAAMSFAVSRRTREIGIRVALGAGALRVAAATFSRPLVQLGVGVVVGAGLTAALAVAVTGGVSAGGAGLVAVYAAAMLGVCLLASIAPVRRALRVDPTEALRGEG